RARQEGLYPHTPAEGRLGGPRPRPQPGSPRPAAAQPRRTGSPAYSPCKSFNFSELRHAQGSGSQAIPEHLPSNTSAAPSRDPMSERRLPGWAALARWTAGRNPPEKSLPLPVARQLTANESTLILGP